MSEKAITDHRVLVVDDDRSICAAVSRFLVRRGYTVDVAYDGQMALELIQRQAYALAVLDYQMPGMNGAELFRAAREIRPELRGIILTAFADIHTVFPVIEAGIERVLAKPPDQKELVPVVEELIGPAS